MKKLMIAAAIVCAAAMSQAANMDWAIDIGYVTGGGDYMAYAVSDLLEFTGVSTGDASIESVLLGTTGNVSPFEDGEEYWGVYTTMGGLNAAEAGSMKDFYIVVVDAAKTGYWAFEASGEIYTTSTSPEMAYVDATELIPGTQITAWSTGPGPEPVPEPTSAMLLLLGVAGLALRRKQA